MPILIGPNFANELIEAGLGGLAMSWSSAGEFVFADSVTQEQREAVQNVYSGHNPGKINPRVEGPKLLQQGLHIIYTGHPEITATYGCSTVDQNNVTAMQAAVQADVFPGYYVDKDGIPHTMTAEQFTVIATAIMEYVLAIGQAVRAAMEPNGVWNAPTHEVTVP